MIFPPFMIIFSPDVEIRFVSGVINFSFWLVLRYVDPSYGKIFLQQSKK